MAVAMMYPDPEKGGRGKKSKVTLEFGSQLLSQARTVLAHSNSVRRHKEAVNAVFPIPSNSRSFRTVICWLKADVIVVVARWNLRSVRD